MPPSFARLQPGNAPLPKPSAALARFDNSTCRGRVLQSTLRCPTAGIAMVADLSRASSALFAICSFPTGIGAFGEPVRSRFP